MPMPQGQELTKLTAYFIVTCRRSVELADTVRARSRGVVVVAAVVVCALPCRLLLLVYGSHDP